MMNVKFVRVKVTKSEFFSFFFFFRKFLHHLASSSSSALQINLFPIIYVCMCIVGQETRRKELCKKKKKVYF